jgi:nitroreductase
MRTFLELSKSRYSVRSYAARPVEENKLARILEAGRVAPTACNNQPQRVKVITDASGLQKVDECTPCRFGAPVVLLICYDKAVCWKRSFDGALSGEVDASIVTTQMMLAAQDLGLGSCWVMYFDPIKARELFGLSDKIVPISMLPLGYPAQDASEQHSDRMPMDKTLLR